MHFDKKKEKICEEEKKPKMTYVRENKQCNEKKRK